MDLTSKNNLMHVGILLVLALILGFLLIHFHIVSCGAVHPAVCDVYYNLVQGGKPSILIVHGNEGIGDPEFFYETLNSPRIRGNTAIKTLDVVSLPILMEYNLVIVEKAKRMSTEEVKMFQDFVARGGRLVWIADAGTLPAKTESDQNYFLQMKHRDGTNNEEFIGPWARREGNRQVSLDIMLGVNYRGNYCELLECRSEDWIGTLDIMDQEKRLVDGIGQNIKIYGDFSLVKLNSESYQTNLAFLNFGTDLIADKPEGYFWLKDERTNFGDEFPAIVATGVGERVVYYAFPPEYFVSEKMPIDEETGNRIVYWGLIENLYYGMLYK